MMQLVPFSACCDLRAFWYGMEWGAQGTTHLYSCSGCKEDCSIKRWEDWSCFDSPGFIPKSIPDESAPSIFQSCHTPSTLSPITNAETE